MIKNEKILFLMKFLRNPVRVGACLPSSKSLSKRIAKYVMSKKPEVLVELGAGSGIVTKALIEAGMKPENIYALEIDPVLCDYMRKNFPGLNVVEGDVKDIKKMLPKELIGKMTVVLSGLPISIVPEALQNEVIHRSYDLLDKGGELVQYCYSQRSPVSAEKYDLVVEKVDKVLANIPPAAIWSYRRAKDVAEKRAA